MGVASGIGSTTFGQMVSKSKVDIYSDYQPTSSVTSGFDGGAIGLGIIAAACFVCFTWLQVNEAKKT